MRGFPQQDTGPGMSELFHDLQTEQEEQKAKARRCQQCGCETKGEEVWVNGQIWCHPCADAVPR